MVKKGKPLYDEAGNALVKLINKSRQDMEVRSFFLGAFGYLITLLPKILRNQVFYVIPGTRHPGYHKNRGLGQIRLITYSSQYEQHCMNLSCVVTSTSF